MLHVQEFSPMKDGVSWTANEFKYFLHVIDRKKVHYLFCSIRLTSLHLNQSQSIWIVNPLVYCSLIIPSRRRIWIYCILCCTNTYQMLLNVHVQNIIRVQIVLVLVLVHMQVDPF